MIKDIASIFNSITPDNIKDIPVIQDAMDVFIETLGELSAESIDIRKVYENEILKEQLVRVYLDDLYNVLKGVQLNEQVIQVVDQINERSGTEFFNKDVIINISKYINEEHFLSFKSYKQNKGTKESIQYIYELVSNLISTDEIDSEFRFKEGTKAFTFEVEGGLPAEIYEYIIYPLAHPVGFTYNYTRYLSLKLEDFFPELAVIYNTRQLEVRSLFEDGSTRIIKYIDKTLTEQEQADLGLDFNLKVIDLDQIQEGTTRIRVVYLNNGTYLRQETTELGQTDVWEYNNDGTLIRKFDGQSSIYLDYTPIFQTTVTDDFASTTFSWQDDNVVRTSLDNVNRYFNIEITKIENYRFFSTDTILAGYSDPELQPYIDNADANGNVDVTDYLLSKNYVLYNEYIDDNGDFIIPGNNTQGRVEIYRGTKFANDLKMLEGKYVEDFQLFDENGELFHTQRIKYTETQNQTPHTTNIMDVSVYEEQNLVNADNIAREHLTQSLQSTVHGRNVLLEMIVPGTETFVNYNGENVPIPTNLLLFVNDKEINGDIKEVGETYFIDDHNLLLKYQGENTSGLVQPDHIYFIETEVEGEVVNLQWETRDDELDIGIYRNGQPVPDGNIAALS